MANRTEISGYTSYTRLITGQCPPSVTGPVPFVYTKRQSNGDDGKGTGVVPRVNGYTATHRSMDAGSLTLSFSRKSFDYPCGIDSLKPYVCSKDHTFAAYPNVAPGPPIEKAELLTKLRSKAFEKLHTFQGGVALAEFAQTARMVISPFRSAMKFTNRICESYIASAYHTTGFTARPNKHRLSKRQAADLAKAARDHYLQWQLGIKPLMSDIQSGTLAFYQNVTNNQPSTRVTRVSFKAISQDYPTSHSESVNGFENCPYTIATSVKSQSSQKAYGYLVHNVSLTGASQSRRNLGFDFESFVPTIWEAIPFSFVADYVTNIGEMIQAFSVDFKQIYGGAYNVKSSSTTTSAPQQVPLYGVPDANNPFNFGPFGVNLTGQSAISKENAFSRSIITGSDFLMAPKFQFQQPSIRQLVNVGALLSSFSHPTLGVAERDKALVRRFFKQ